MTPVLKHNKSQTTTYLSTITQILTINKESQRIGNVSKSIKDRYKREKKDPLKHYE
jgi:hypothetical protein